MKKGLCLIFAVVIILSVFSLSGCGGDFHKKETCLICKGLGPENIGVFFKDHISDMIMTEGLGDVSTGEHNKNYSFYDFKTCPDFLSAIDRQIFIPDLSLWTNEGMKAYLLKIYQDKDMNQNKCSILLTLRNEEGNYDYSNYYTLNLTITFDYEEDLGDPYEDNLFHLSDEKNNEFAAYETVDGILLKYIYTNGHHVIGRSPVRNSIGMTFNLYGNNYWLFFGYHY